MYGPTMLPWSIHPHTQMQSLLVHFKVFLFKQREFGIYVCDRLMRRFILKGVPAWARRAFTESDLLVSREEKIETKPAQLP